MFLVELEPESSPGGAHIMIWQPGAGGETRLAEFYRCLRMQWSKNVDHMEHLPMGSGGGESPHLSCVAIKMRKKGM